MERENKRVCVVCGKELEKPFQHKYCSKACESLDRKGKKVGSYDEDRVQAMALAKKDAYKKRNLEPLSSDIRELIKYGYISDLPSLAYHLKKLQPDNTSINSNRLKKYFNYYPEDYKIFLNAKKFPKMFQKRDPSWFRNYEKFLEDKNINGWIFYKKIKNEDFIINSNISLYDLEKSCTILGYNFSERYSKIEDVLNNNNQKISRKWTEAKKILEEANFEEFFKTPIVVGAWEEWKSVVREKGKSLGVSFCMCKRYIEEKNIKINLEYSDEKLAYYKLKKYLKITEEDINFIKNDLEVNVTYINLERGTYVQESNIDVFKGAKLNVTSKYLTIDEKIINLNYINKDRYSEVNIDNSCVCLDKSVLKLDCTGKIEKGAKVSKNHQSSRCLTIDNPKKAEIKPILLIDENDVEASHSLSSGTIDRDVLFYLYSRGISYHDAMILFIHSYLLPQEEVFDGIDDAEEIISYLNEKVVNIYA